MDAHAHFKFWGTLGLACAILIAAVGAVGIADSCWSGFALSEIRKPTAAGCGDFWLNRYQGTVIGIFTVAVAAWTAANLVKQIQKMNESNDISTKSLTLAREGQKMQEIMLRRERNKDLAAFLDVVVDLPDLIQDARDEILSHADTKAKQVEFSILVRRFRSLGIMVLDDEERHAEERKIFRHILDAVEILTTTRRGAYQRVQRENEVGGLHRFFSDAFKDLVERTIPSFRERVFGSSWL